MRDQETDPTPPDGEETHDNVPGAEPAAGQGAEPAAGPGAEPAAGPGADADPEDGEGERELPDAPLFALLRSIHQEVTIERIDRIWIFPPRRLDLGETAVVIVSAYPDADPGRRRVLAAHYMVAADATAPRLALDEFGTAPADRVGRVVEDVLERIKDGPADAPHAARIEGDVTRWHQLLHSLAERYLNDTLYPARPRGFTRPQVGRRGGRNRGSGGTVGGGHTTPA